VKIMRGCGGRGNFARGTFRGALEFSGESLEAVVEACDLTAQPPEFRGIDGMSMDRMVRHWDLESL
jgi:hypothetical protein